MDLQKSLNSPSNNKVSVFIAIPNMGTLETELSIRCLEWQANVNYLTAFWTPSYIRPIPAARNNIVIQFLKSSCTWLLMIDDDIVPPSNILDLTGFGKDVISPLIFTMKNEELIPLALIEKEDGKLHIIREIEMNSLIKVSAIGTGCLLIHRRVFSHLQPPFFQYIMSKEGLLFEGEDLDFCRRIREKRLKIFLHTGYIAKHYLRIDITGFALKWQQPI